MFRKILITSILFSLAGMAVAQKPYARGGNKGIYVFFGTGLPHGFIYKLQRRDAGKGEWIEITQTDFPYTSGDFKGRLLEFSNLSAQHDGISSAAVNERIYSKLDNSNTTDSLSFNAINPAYLYACGNLWLDNTAAKNKTYDYRVTKVSGKNEEEIATFSGVSYPGKYETVKLKRYRMGSIDNVVHVEYSFDQDDLLRTFKVFRAYYQHNSFEAINPGISVKRYEDKLVLDVRDETAIGKIGYSYYVVPVDLFGNTGFNSDTISLYNVEQNTIQPSVMNFRTESVEKPHGIKLSWNKVDRPADIVSIELYRSEQYDGIYHKLASLEPTATTYTDIQVQPVVTYYYNIVLNGNYETSPPSARVAGMLKAWEPNPIPPQNLQAIQVAPKVIKLTWFKAEANTRGYYVHRSTSANILPVIYGNIILSDSFKNEYYDTIGMYDDIKELNYAVTDVNTSYEISPLSNLVSVQLQQNKLPDPAIASIRLVEDTVLLLWDDYRLQNSSVGAYNLYRQVQDDEGNIVEDWKKLHDSSLVFSIHSWKDQKIPKGKTCYYALQCVDFSGAVTSSKGPLSYVTLHDEYPLPVKNIKAFADGEKISLQWDAPSDKTIKAIKIYRSAGSKAPELLTTLAPGTGTYSDKGSYDKNYTYYIVTENIKGLESRNPEPVSITPEKE